MTGYKPGATVAGEVRYIGDGDSICIGNGPDPHTWTEIRIANWYAPETREPGGAEAKAALTRIITGKRLICTAVRGDGGRTVSYDRLIARCEVDGRDLGDAMREAGVKEGGRGR